LKREPTDGVVVEVLQPRSRLPFGLPQRDVGGHVLREWSQQEGLELRGGSEPDLRLAAVSDPLMKGGADVVEVLVACAGFALADGLRELTA